MILACNGEQYNVFPQILGKFANRFEHVEHQNRTYINLDALECRGVEVFALVNTASDAMRNTKSSIDSTSTAAPDQRGASVSVMFGELDTMFSRTLRLTSSVSCSWAK